MISPYIIIVIDTLGSMSFNNKFNLSFCDQLNNNPYAKDSLINTWENRIKACLPQIKINMMENIKINTMEDTKINAVLLPIPFWFEQNDILDKEIIEDSFKNICNSTLYFDIITNLIKKRKNNNLYEDNNNINQLNFIFDSRLVEEYDLIVGQLRLLEVTQRLNLPLQNHLRIIITSSDVLHSWAVPSIGIKIDACPGRLNQLSIFIMRPGIYYGQCSEICGINHAFIPICVESLK